MGKIIDTLRIEIRQIQSRKTGTRIERILEIGDLMGVNHAVSEVYLGDIRFTRQHIVAVLIEADNTIAEYVHRCTDGKFLDVGCIGARSEISSPRTIGQPLRTRHCNSRTQVLWENLFH